MVPFSGLYVEAAKLAPAGFAFALHIKDGQPCILENTYPKEWVRHYREKSYLLRDPTIAWGLENTGIASWTCDKIKDPLGIVEDARRNGLNHGFAMSTGEPNDRSIGSMARQDRPFTRDECLRAFEVFKSIHEVTKPRCVLTKAQIEALRLIANGERHARAAAQLGISESALKARLKTARLSLAAKTTAEAIQMAQNYRMF